MIYNINNYTLGIITERFAKKFLSRRYVSVTELQRELTSISFEMEDNSLYGASICYKALVKMLSNCAERDFFSYSHKYSFNNWEEAIVYGYYKEPSLSLFLKL